MQRKKDVYKRQQYAYARICSIFRNLAAEGITRRECTAEELKALNTPEERELTLHIAALKMCIRDSSSMECSVSAAQISFPPRR